MVMRAAEIDPVSFEPMMGMVINVIMVNTLSILPNLVQADTAGNIDDWWTGYEFIPPYDPRHPLYVAPEVK